MSVQHWKFQRISAVALIPIVLFSLYYIVSLGTVSYDHLINDLGSFTGFIITSLFMGFISVSYTHLTLPTKRIV